MCFKPALSSDPSESQESENDANLAANHEEIITIDVGGTIFRTTKKNLCQSGYFARVFSNANWKREQKLNSNGDLFVDRNPVSFSLVVSLLRGERPDAIIRTRYGYCPESNLLIAELMNEAEFYEIPQPKKGASEIDETEKVNKEHEEKPAESNFKANVFAGIIVGLILANFYDHISLAIREKNEPGFPCVSNSTTAQDHLFPDPDSWYTITSFHSGRVLHVNKMVASYKAKYFTVPYNGNFQQQWRFEAVMPNNGKDGEINFLIISRSNDPLIVWNKNSTSANVYFKFRLHEADGGYFFIQYADNDNIMILEDSQSVIESYQFHGGHGYTQKWRIDKH